MTDTIGKRIALFGGTFDPFHCAHRQVIESAISQLPVDAVMVMPLGQAPHKDRRISLAAFRYEMARLGIMGIAKAIVSDDEIKTPGDDYTYETVLRLQDQLQPSQIYIIGGSDILFAIDSWYRVQDLLRKVTLSIVRRGDDDLDAIELKAKETTTRYGANIVYFDMPASSQSSSHIRSALKKGDNISGLCPLEVESLINRHQLYSFSHVYAAISDDDWGWLMEIQSFSWPYLSQKRRLHSASVAHYAAKLAFLYEVDVAKAVAGGLLHDIAKELPLSEQVDMANRFNRLSDITMADLSDELMHGPAAAGIAFTRFNISDKNLLNAIAFHSTARPGMGKLEQILFLADKIAYDRTFSRLEPIRTLAESGELDKAVKLCLEEIFQALHTKGIKLNHMSTAAYKEY